MARGFIWLGGAPPQLVAVDHIVAIEPMPGGRCKVALSGGWAVYEKADAEDIAARIIRAQPSEVR